jgi:LacI family transcriptional regulator
MRRVTISDVADLAKVSKATVSHVINNTRFVEEGTRNRVLAAVKELGYQPSLVARSLATNRTETIGIIVSDVTNNFFGDVLSGIEDYCRPYNYRLLVCNTAETLEREDQFIEMLLRQRVDGIIDAAASQKWDIIKRADIEHTPLVFADRAYDGLSGPYVGVKNCEGALLGVQHLIECGHQKIGILAGFQRLSTMRDRLAGFRQAMYENGKYLPEEWIITSPLSIEAGREATLKLLTLPDHPTAMLISNNLLSLGVLLAIKDLSLHCPEDIAVIGFDDHPWAAVSNPPLTVIRQPSRCVGQAAAKMLIELINGRKLPETRVLMNCELILRQSCCLHHS